MHDGEKIRLAERLACVEEELQVTRARLGASEAASQRLRSFLAGAWAHDGTFQDACTLMFVRYQGYALLPRLCAE